MSFLIDMSTHTKASISDTEACRPFIILYLKLSREVFT